MARTHPSDLDVSPVQLVSADPLTKVLHMVSSSVDLMASRASGRRSISFLYGPFRSASLRSCWCGSTTCTQYQEALGCRSVCSLGSD